LTTMVRWDKLLILFFFFPLHSLQCVGSCTHPIIVVVHLLSTVLFLLLCANHDHEIPRPWTTASIYICTYVYTQRRLESIDIRKFNIHVTLMSLMFASTFSTSFSKIFRSSYDNFCSASLSPIRNLYANMHDC
jgi:hypothetical protein